MNPWLNTEKMTIEEKIEYYRLRSEYCSRVYHWKLKIDHVQKMRKLHLRWIRDSWIRQVKRSFYYHGTTEDKIDHILTEGLKPNSMISPEFITYNISKPNSIYFASDPYLAEKFAEANKYRTDPKASYFKQKTFLILIPKRLISKKEILPDENLYEDEPSFRIENRVFGPEEIQVIEFQEHLKL